MSQDMKTETPEPTEPKIETTWPWVLIEKTTDKVTGKIIKWTAQGLSTAAVSKIKIPYCTGKQIYDFRRGKAIEFELEDVKSLYWLYRQGESRGHLNTRLARIAQSRLKMVPPVAPKIETEAEQSSEG